MLTDYPIKSIGVIEHEQATFAIAGSHSSAGATARGTLACFRAAIALATIGALVAMTDPSL